MWREIRKFSLPSVVCNGLPLTGIIEMTEDEDESESLKNKKIVK